MCIQTLKSTAGRACHPFRKLQKTWCPEEAAILLSIRRPHPLPSQGPRTVSHAHIYSNHHGLEMFTPSSFNLYQGSPQGSSQHVSCLSPKRGSLCLLKCYSSLKVCLMLLTLWILLWHILWMWVSFYLYHLGHRVLPKSVDLYLLLVSEKPKLLILWIMPLLHFPYFSILGFQLHIYDTILFYSPLFLTSFSIPHLSVL